MSKTVGKPTGFRGFSPVFEIKVRALKSRGLQVIDIV